MEIKPTKSVNDVVSHLLTLSPALRQEVYHYIDFLRARNAESADQDSKKGTSAVRQTTLNQSTDRKRQFSTVKPKSVLPKSTKEPLEDFEDLFSMKD